MRSVIGWMLLGALWYGVQAAAGEPASTRVELDAREASSGLVHAHITFPTSGSQLDVAYPKWIPGEHSPSGPLTQVIGLGFHAGATRLAWHRDATDPFLFHVALPPGVTQVEADLDFACAIGESGFRSDICSSWDQLVVNWWTVLLYRPDLPNDANPFSASVRLPAGWQFASPLQSGAQTRDGLVVLPTVALKTLVDSPLIAARNLRRIDLGGTHAELDLSSETAAALDVPPEHVEHFRRLIAEAEALFGGARYPHYNLLLSLGDALDHYTLEHAESSENRLPAQGLRDARILRTTATLIPHEYIHAWNGKARTPRGLDIVTYQDPMRAGLIWVYEGLTEYYANVLAARSGFWSTAELADSLAIDAAQMTYHTGRTWRPLQDTMDGAQLLLTSPTAWVSARRNVDFYPESALMWLEADTLIRERSHGRRSLDDFARSFLGPAAPRTPYSFEDVVAALEAVQPYEWSRFLREHLDSTDPQPPTGGLAHAGWQLDYSAAKSPLVRELEAVHKLDLLWPMWESFGFTDLRYSIGLLVQDDGTVLDSAPGMAGYRARIVPGMRIRQVNGAAFSLPGLEAAVAASAAGTPVSLDVANGAQVTARALDYAGGLRYPRLVRVAGRPDMLADIARPRARGAAP